MPRNVEIKAVVRNVNRIRDLAKSLCNTEAEILGQHDTFYKVSSGRLKLRQFQSEATAQLIFYNRPDSEGPKISDFSVCPVTNPEELNNVLASSLGVLGEVKKIRFLYIYDQTRIHIDQVEGLGNFMELEVCLRPDQSLEQGKSIAEDLIVKLEVDRQDLISGAYLDHLNQ